MRGRWGVGLVSALLLRIIRPRAPATRAAAHRVLTFEAQGRHLLVERFKGSGSRSRNHVVFAALNTVCTFASDGHREAVRTLDDDAVPHVKREAKGVKSGSEIG